MQEQKNQLNIVKVPLSEILNSRVSEIIAESQRYYFRPIQNNTMDIEEKFLKERQRYIDLTSKLQAIASSGHDLFNCECGMNCSSRRIWKNTVDKLFMRLCVMANDHYFQLRHLWEDSGRGQWQWIFDDDRGTGVLKYYRELCDESDSLSNN